MLNYDYQNPTRLVFGRGTQKQVGALVRGYADRVLLVYGGGSIKKSGLYGEVTASLRAAGVSFTELPGVVPNPRVTLAREGARLCREQSIPFVLAVGGGSAIDTAKAVAAGALYDGDLWDFCMGKKIERALPVGTVLTIPATGSESSPKAVLTNEELKIKKSMGSDLLRPAFSILNPELCETLPPEQIGYSAFDMMSHIMERYFTNTPHTEVIDGLSESLLRTIMKQALILRGDSKNYDAWCELVEAGNLAHNGLLGLGREQDWACHGMEHELSALYDIPHGAGLAAVTPAWMRYAAPKHLPLFGQFAVEVMGVRGSLRDPEELAEAGISALEDFSRRMGLPVRLHELGIGGGDFALMAEKSVQKGGGTLGHLEELSARDVENIFGLAL